MFNLHPTPQLGPVRFCWHRFRCTWANGVSNGRSAFLRAMVAWVQHSECPRRLHTVVSQRCSEGRVRLHQVRGTIEHCSCSCCCHFTGGCLGTMHLQCSPALPSMLTRLPQEKCTMCWVCFIESNRPEHVHGTQHVVQKSLNATRGSGLSVML